MSGVIIVSNGMPSWDEWRNLTEDQRQYSQHKVLSDLYLLHQSREASCKIQVKSFSDDINLLKRRKWFDKGIAMVAGGITAILAVLGIRIGT